MGTKVCRLCGLEKPLDDFYPAPGMRDGHRSECKVCNRAQRAARYRDDPVAQERARRKAREWAQANPERVREKQAAYREDGRIKKSIRKTHLKKKYGLTPEDYDRMLEAQGGGCAICGKAPRPDISLHIDHDHETGRIRGLLCFTCNNGLGQFQDDPELLIAAAEYVGVHQRVAQLIASADN
jgi:hypothetical protein